LKLTKSLISEVSVIQSPKEVTWVHFDRFVRAGVPHAIDIAQVLVTSNLTVPVSPNFDLGKADLIYYSAIHAAHRCRALGRFLAVMEELRGHKSWELLRNCRSAQLTLVETLGSVSSTDNGECIKLLEAWMNDKDRQPLGSESSSYCTLKTDMSIRRAA
jgi:hypothetical protein